MSTLQDPYGGPPIDFAEVPGSGDFSFSSNVFTARRVFLVDWQERFRFCRAAMGRNTVLGKDTQAPYLSRTPPLAHADLIDTRALGQARPVLYATQVERIDGVAPTPHRTGLDVREAPGVTGGRYSDPTIYQQARVSLVFEAPTFSVQPDEDCPTGSLRVKRALGANQLLASLGSSYVGRLEAKRYTTRITQPLTESLRIPINYWQYVEGLSDNGSVTSKPGKLVDIGSYVLYPTLEVQWHFHRVPALVQPWEAGGEWLFQETNVNPQIGSRPELLGACFTHLGCVNSRYFDGFAPGTLLLTAVEARPYKWLTGERLYDYVFRAKHFNPMDAFRSGSFAVVNGPVDQAGNPTYAQSRNPAVGYSYVGHNYLPRMDVAAKAAGGVLQFTTPYYALVTDNGQAPEAGGRPLFPYRDFEDLFVPYNRAQLTGFYNRATLAPLWVGDNPGT